MCLALQAWRLIGAETIPIPEKSRFRFLDLFWEFCRNWYRNQSQNESKRNRFSDSRFLISEIGKINRDSRFLILRNRLSTRRIMAPFRYVAKFDPFLFFGLRIFSEYHIAWGADFEYFMEGTNFHPRERMSVLFLTLPASSCKWVQFGGCSNCPPPQSYSHFHPQRADLTTSALTSVKDCIYRDEI